MQPDPTNLLGRIDLNTPLIGFYDAPDAAPFEPLVRPAPGKRVCVFAFYRCTSHTITMAAGGPDTGCLASHPGRARISSNFSPTGRD